MEHVSKDCYCEGKKCTKCQTVKCVGAFSVRRRLKSGLRSDCRLCSNASNKEWRDNNREHNYTRVKKWNEENKEKVHDTKKLWIARNRSNVNATQRRYYARNAESIRKKESERSKAKRRNQPAKIKIARVKQPLTDEQKAKRVQARSAIWRNYYIRNKAHLNNKAMEWRKANPRRWAALQATRRARKTLAGGNYTTEEWESLCIKYDHACLWCGKKEPEIELTADHVIPVIKGGSSDIGNIQPLCRSCNARKGTKIMDFRAQNT
jgi:5-methylcytosine-specific restriction endonuclease McrA